MELMMFAVLGPWEIVGLLFLALLLFGSKKLPELAKGLGTGLKEFKKATSDVTDELKSAIEDDPSQQYRSRPTPPPAYTQPTAPANTEAAAAPQPEGEDNGGSSSSATDRNFA